jgi:HAD superfamily hydrolase (TIGR01509 family)
MGGDVRSSLKDWLGALRSAGYVTALLSDMPLDKIRHVRKNFHWLSFFDQPIRSAEVRFVKPDPRIFRLCLERLGVRAVETIFIGDNEENVSAGQSLGLTAIGFRSVAQLKRDLRSVGVRPLPS